jgi:hypothetical protein
MRPLQGLFKSIPVKLSQIRDKGWKATFLEVKQAFIGPPKLVDWVTEKLKGVGEPERQGQWNEINGELPRFGIWQGSDSYVVGIDKNENSKMISLFGEDFYSPNLAEIIHFWVEHLF